MSDMIACLNDLSYIPPNNKQNVPTQGDIGEISNEPTQAKRNEFEELYASAKEELYPGCNFVTRLDFMAKFTYFKVKGRKVPKEVLCYFLIIPRLQHLYKSSHTAKEMTWHATGKCTEPGKMQHPVDGRAWKNFYTKYLDFTKEPRNVRLGLAANGFNTFGNLSQSYNMWPVILTKYNLPLWLCMKESSFMLTLLIPGPKSPGKDIDVYLRPLIDDLKDLWPLKGVKTIDIATGQKFNMRAMVLWTINDFLAQSSLSGWSGQGVKQPDGFGSNFKHKVTDNDTNITSLKSHDCHITMQRLLPYGLQQYLPSAITTPIIELCSFFKKICSQTLMEDDMLKAQRKVVNVLCNIKLIYPPAFFDIMIYLVIYLPLEALEGGPICPRWMYSFERCMKKLKNYVRNKAKPEGSIAEGYVAEEALTLSSHYFWDVSTKFNRPDRNKDYPPLTCQFQVFQSICKLIGLRLIIRFGHQELKKVTWYVPHNSPEIDTYRAKFKSLNDLDFATLHIDGQSMDVDAPTYIIDVDEDNDIIDDEDALSHDVADSDDEDRANVDDDDDDVAMSTDIARGHPRDGDGVIEVRISGLLQGQPKTQFGRQESWQAEYPQENQEPQGVPDALQFSAQHPRGAEGDGLGKDW
nr:hypothetical protein [Tanacetum cinerariifolium]